MRPKRPHFLSIALAALCGTWLVVAPVLPQLHQALAEHRHVFCLEHDRVEDQAFVTSPGREEPTQAGDQPGPSIHDAASLSGHAQGGRECLSSNFSAQAVFRASGFVSASICERPLRTRPIFSIEIPSGDTLRIAPKTSPPAV